MSGSDSLPAIREYGLIGDCHGAALVSPAGSIDWCCLPRFDSPSCFARILDSERGGFCAVTLEGGVQSRSSSYVEDTLVLETALQSPLGAVRVLDFMALSGDDALAPDRELVRIVECDRGELDLSITLAPRFDYGSVRPWLRRVAADTFSVVGGHDGLLAWSDGTPEISGDSLVLSARLRPGERLRLVMRFVRPHELDHARGSMTSATEADARLEQTLQWWRDWRAGLSEELLAQTGVTRSALTLKALAYAPTGAIAAAATTSLPEAMGAARNWDYRYSWIRDSTLSAHALSELGCEREARSFRHFIVRSCAGHADDLQIMFGLAGERRLPEAELDLAGYGGSRPVRIGNGAAGQLQLDALGELLNLAWRWHLRGHSPDDDEWRFFAELVEVAVEQWDQPDCGIWEWRGDPRHFVHSKACCWAAVDRGLRLAEEGSRRAPVRRWRRAREQIREAIETRGYDKRRGIFVQSFDGQALDGALLLLPVVGFIEFDDERMVRTTDAVREELEANGFLYRYTEDDGLDGQEGAFLPCSFWLAECYARQGRLREAREVFDRAAGAAGPLGLLSEEVDPASGQLLGNYPQTLTHLSLVAAAIALVSAEGHTGLSATVVG
ncbi:MAG TPA: glycoside hydrolase family 15 protein [Solirubrobacteraceae bacterium]|nr:glycoside hydrolase family 15 protein [Solirubrobacteraceae bacterium]